MERIRALYEHPHAATRRFVDSAADDLHLPHGRRSVGAAAGGATAATASGGDCGMPDESLSPAANVIKCHPIHLQVPPLASVTSNVCCTTWDVQRTCCAAALAKELASGSQGMVGVEPPSPLGCSAPAARVRISCGGVQCHAHPVGCAFIAESMSPNFQSALAAAK